MLGGEGNQNGEKTAIGLVSKKATLHVQHTFFVHFFAAVCFARLQRKTSRNFLATRFMEEMSYVFFFTFVFSLPLIFTLVAANISHFFTAATEFSCCSSKERCLSRSSSPSPFFSLTFAGLSPTFSFSIFQICAGHDN